jgi:hypothetical protein
MTSSYLDTIRGFYPIAFCTETLEEEVLSYLRQTGIDPNEVVTANCVCSDDINEMQFPLADGSLPGPFFLGGLNGFPFGGLTGVQAFAQHIPDHGTALVYYGPHIGITEKGEIGKVRCPGHDQDSNCCGAVQAALEKISGATHQPTDLDYQEDTIVDLFRANRERILAARYPIQEATEVMYEAIDERLRLLIDQSKEQFKAKYLVLIGSVFINTDHGLKACIEQRTFRTTNLRTNVVTDHLELFRDYLAAGQAGDELLSIKRR